MMEKQSSKEMETERKLMDCFGFRVYGLMKLVSKKGSGFGALRSLGG